MIAANMAAYNYQEPHPFWFRLYGSFAAPTFILLSGFMVPYNASKQQYGFNYFLIRGLLIICVAALMDYFLWELIPFTSFDVLYVIGISLPVSFLFSKVNQWIHLVVAAMVIIVAPVLQMHFGYNSGAAEVPAFAPDKQEIWMQAPILKNFLIEGWFPIFPWMGVALLGSFAGRIRMKFSAKRGNNIFLISGFILFGLGLMIWLIQSPELLVREGYSELFYPPTVGYLFTFLGLIFSLIAILQPISNSVLLRVFAVYGRSSLLMYILHTIFIVFFLKEAFVSRPFSQFAAIYFLHAFFLWWIALFVQLVKENFKRMPFLLRFLLGG